MAICDAMLKAAQHKLIWLNNSLISSHQQQPQTEDRQQGLAALSMAKGQRIHIRNTKLTQVIGQAYRLQRTGRQGSPQIKLKEGKRGRTNNQQHQSIRTCQGIMHISMFVYICISSVHWAYTWANFAHAYYIKHSFEAKHCMGSSQKTKHSMK